MKKYFLLLFVFTLLALSTTVLAQTNDEQIPNTVNCFDYYKFGSVSADMTSRSSNALAGMTMDFFGDIKNNNNYPIVAGTLYVKIFRNVGGEKNPNGPDVVDQFIALDNITIPENGSVPASFSWKVPSYAQSGNYQLVTYFTSGKKINISGLSFSDSVIGNSFDFTVSGEKTGVFFDKSSIVMNNSPYYFSAYTAPVPKDINANISIKINNTTNQVQNTKIIWKLYKWDAVNPSNLIRTFATSTTLKANSFGVIEVSIPEKDDPMYYLVGELTYKDSKSIVGIKFVKDGVDKARFNLVTATSYPLPKGEAETVLACFNNIGSTEQLSNGKVVLEVKDQNGKNVESYTYEGVITKGIIAVKKDFVSKVNLNTFSVHASLYTDGKLVDQSTIKYDCNLIDPRKCIKEDDKMMGMIAFLGGLLALILIFVYMKLSKNNKNIVVPTVMFLLGVCLFNPAVIEAKSVNWSTTINDNNLKYYRMDDNG